MLYLGLYLFLGGTLAYSLVGLTPSFNGFESRHQVLLKFGAVLLVIHLISLIRSLNLQVLCLSWLICSFGFTTFYNQLQFQKSWIKQLAIEKFILKSKQELFGTNFLVIDQTKNYNEFNSGFALYNYTGIISKVYHKENSLAMNYEFFNQFGSSPIVDIITLNTYHLRDVNNFVSFQKLLIINSGKRDLDFLEVINMTYLYFIDNDKFKFYLSDFVTFKIVLNT